MSVGKAALFRALVDNHGVLHIVALKHDKAGWIRTKQLIRRNNTQNIHRVGDDGDDGVGAQRKLVKVVLVVHGVADHGRLRRAQAVQLVVRAVLERVAREAHRLLAHLHASNQNKKQKKKKKEKKKKKKKKEGRRTKKSARGGRGQPPVEEEENKQTMNA